MCKWVNRQLCNWRRNLDCMSPEKWSSTNLRHLVTFPFPGQSLIIERLLVGAYVYWLPLLEQALSLAGVYYRQSGGNGVCQPLLGEVRKGQVLKILNQTFKYQRLLNAFKNPQASMENLADISEHQVLANEQKDQ